MTVYENRYIILNGCRPHACSEQAFVWIDTEAKTSITSLSSDTT